jgi:PIN domain nuclease of toxin-antitoxin system
VSVLLDTHIWIWWLLGQPDLLQKERDALDATAARELPIISAISLWEAQMLHAKGRLTLAVPFDRWLREAAAPDVVRVAPLDINVVLAVDALPARFHGDPADLGSSLPRRASSTCPSPPTTAISGRHGWCAHGSHNLGGVIRRAQRKINLSPFLRTRPRPAPRHPRWQYPAGTGGAHMEAITWAE